MIKTVLLIGDDFKNLVLIKINLQSIVNWKIFITDSISEAIFEAYIKPPDVVLLDINVPRANMVKVVFILRKNSTTKHIPIIIFMDRPWEISERGCIHFGIKGIISKPFDRLTLLDQIIQTID